MKPHIVQPGRFPDTPPGVLEVGQASPGLLACDDEIVVLKFLYRFDSICGGGA